MGERAKTKDTTADAAARSTQTPEPIAGLPLVGSFGRSPIEVSPASFDRTRDQVKPPRKHRLVPGAPASDRTALCPCLAEFLPPQSHERGMIMRRRIGQAKTPCTPEPSERASGVALVLVFKALPKQTKASSSRLTVHERQPNCVYHPEHHVVPTDEP